ncbi:MAG: hypothetical protein HY704_15430, partial [Gemmatimonadetes bacterium]|nr:hypothetical protein [Gemmatimonadota bacterium]
GHRRGDWVTATADLQIQQRGFTLSAAGFGRSVTPEDARVGSYEGAGGEISGGYALVANRLELVGRYGQLRWDVDDPDTREAGWDLVLTLYHRGHAWKTRMQYSNRRRVAEQGLGSDRSLIVETQLLF